MENQSIKAVLSPSARELFEDIDTQRVLGAGNHIKMIADMFLDIAASGQSADTMLQGVHSIADYFTKTRGESSRAISNAAAEMTGSLRDTQDSAEAAAQIKSSVFSFRKKSDAGLKKINACLSKLLVDIRSVMLYDYSGTVNNIAALASQRGRELDCYIPESRVLDGGRPYLHSFLERGHRIHFIPDCAMYDYIGRCDAAFIGSETCYPDGTSFNTVGSELLGLLCKTFRVPLYVPTPLIKLDMRALDGYQKPPIIDNLTARMAGGWEEGESAGIDFTCPELVAIPPEYIAAFITEEGIIPPWGMYAAALRYQAGLEASAIC